jgi:hypothetical protein
LKGREGTLHIDTGIGAWYDVGDEYGIHGIDGLRERTNRTG